ncbi:MAG: aldo/keto reductase [Anaeroplasmataceae bacterium]|nr:aldo/keto reductase [Anaeroplasmataceae bacterium]
MYFDGVKKNFGFGFMRLPMKNKEVDYEELNKMVDTFLENGFNYFDTAHGYVEKKSEIAIRECLAKRYKRESFILTNKLTNFFFTKQEDIRPFFESQLEACGVDYFDFYLMHAQSKENFAFFKKCHAYETALELKKEGKIKHFGISFHDTADVLDQILSEYPQIEVVQIQLNYVDFDDAAVQSRKCYEVCRKYNKPVIIMEPVKGGNLVNLPSDAQKIFDDLQGGSNASYAIRFAAGFDGVFMVLSGMSNMEQMLDNISYMKDFKPLNEKEKEAVHQVCDVFKNMHLIACTACRYCVAGCPKHISIPDLFSCMNTKNIYHDWNANYYYSNVHTKFGGKASDCIECGKCENACPQHLPIRKLLKDVAKEFEG